MHQLKRVRTAVPDPLILIGSGVTEHTARVRTELAGGAIVGRTVMRHERTGAGIDSARA